MDTLLVDLWQAGHHLEHLQRTQQTLEAESSNGSVDVVLPSSTSRTEALFDDAAYVLEEFEELLDEDRTHAVVTALHRVFDLAADRGYDVVHLLELDRVVNEFSHVVRERAPDASVFASLNGAFFSSRPAHLTVRNRLAGAPGASRVLDRLPPGNPLRTHEHALKRILEASLLECLFVPTVEARDAVRGVTAEQSPPIRVVPDPTDPLNGDDHDRAEARSEVGLPDDELTLLLFGELRREKGVDVLFRAMEEYRDAPPITLVVAGSETEAVEVPTDRVADVDSVRLVTDLRFVPPDEMEAYFVATDGVVVPYRRSFGRARPSGVFQKAVASSSPVIAPDFGVFSRRVAEYDLGLLFEPESPPSLRDAVARFARRDGDVVSSIDSFEMYAELQSYERYVAVLRHAYDHC